MAAIGEFGLLGVLRGVNLNSANTDTAFNDLPVGWRPTKITMGNLRLAADPDSATTTLGATSTATTGVFTATGGGGTAIVATGTVAAMTSKDVPIDRTIATTTIRRERTVYFRVTVAQGAAAVCDVFLFGEQMQ